MCFFFKLAASIFYTNPMTFNVDSIHHPWHKNPIHIQVLFLLYLGRFQLITVQLLEQCLACQCHVSVTSTNQKQEVVGLIATLSTMVEEKLILTVTNNPVIYDLNTWKGYHDQYLK